MTASAPLTIQDIALRRSRLDEAFVEMYGNLPPKVRQELQMRTARIGSAGACMVGSVPIVLFNRVVNLGVGMPCTPEQVDELVALYGAEGLPFMVQLSPIAMPASLPEWLEARGVVQKDAWAIFTRDLSPPPEVTTDLRVERVGQELAPVFGETLARGYGLPPSLVILMTALVGHAGAHCYLAYHGETPVAAASMLVEGRTARFVGAGTLAEFRRRGGQGALLARRIRDAAALGCDLITVETADDPPERPNPSYHNMLRCGFRLAYMQPNYIYTPS